jgi:hypothetical protein
MPSLLLFTSGHEQGVPVSTDSLKIHVLANAHVIDL